MATEKDKTIRELHQRYLRGDIDTEHDLDVAIWDAARADAIEECAQIADGFPTYPVSIGDEIRRSLSSKQEEPR